MFIKGSAFKLVLGVLGTLVLSAAAAGVVYFGFVKPYAPEILDAFVNSPQGSCEPVLTIIDKSQNETEFRLYRWGPAEKALTLIQVWPPSPGKGTHLTYTDTALPPGKYTYMVSAVNRYGESNSGQVSVNVLASVLPICDPSRYIDPTTLPMNPLIVKLTIINDCSVQIAFRDNSTNEQGFKIYRYDNTFKVIKTLGPHTGIPVTYDDNTQLAPGWYGYKIVAFNQYGEAASNFKGINVTSVCNPAQKALPTVDALVFPTAQKQSLAVPTATTQPLEACTWQAASDVFLRKGPDVALFDRLIDVQSGMTFPIVGQSEDGQFWAVEVSPGVIGYISRSPTFSLTSGDCSNVPILTDPAPPVILPGATRKPGTNPIYPTPIPTLIPDMR